MDATELRRWITAHAELIFAFMDYEPTLVSESELSSMLGESWFRDPDWNAPGYGFVDLGHDGMGGQFVLWDRHDASRPPPVVYFGSDGDVGVLASTPKAWAQVIAHAPDIEGSSEGPDAIARLVPGESPFHGDSPDDPEAAAALIRYRTAVVQRFGALPSFGELTAVPDELNDELHPWVRQVVERADARESAHKQREQQARADARRKKATAYAQRSMPSLAGPSLVDGSVVNGPCPSCGTDTELRVTHFETLVFALCYRCYFSDAW